MRSNGADTMVPGDVAEFFQDDANSEGFDLSPRLLPALSGPAPQNAQNPTRPPGEVHASH